MGPMGAGLEHDFFGPSGGGWVVAFLWERNYGLWEERLCPREDGELLSLPF